VRIAPSVEQSGMITRGLPEIGLGGMDQLRVLVCEGESLLGWVGAFRREPFGWKERTLLAELTPALRQRLWLERQLGASELALAAMDQALALLPSAAFVVQTQSGRIAHANAAGKLRLRADPKGLQERIAASLRRKDPGSPWLALALAARGAPGYALLVEREATPVSGADVERLSAEWGLTPRQAEVFRLLLRGYANKSIAAELQCSARTVEQHVTAVLAKAGANSRAELIVRSTRLP
jgi:DNA-binding NarL/FixJ family response regulator